MYHLIMNLGVEIAALLILLPIIGPAALWAGRRMLAIIDKQMEDIGQKIETLRLENREDHKSTSAKVDKIVDDMHELRHNLGVHLAWHEAIEEEDEEE